MCTLLFAISLIREYTVFTSLDDFTEKDKERTNEGVKAIFSRNTHIRQAISTNIHYLFVFINGVLFQLVMKIKPVQLTLYF